MNYLVVGKRACGKTTLVKHLCGELDNPVIVLCRDYGVGRDYCDITNNIYLYKEENVDKFLMGRDSSSEPVTFVFSDTCIGDRQFLKSPLWRKLCMNGRCYRVNVIVELHYMHMPPELRANVDNIYVFKDINTTNRKSLWKYFFGNVPTFRQFEELMDISTQDYECLVSSDPPSRVKAPFPAKPIAHVPIPYSGVRFAYASR